MCETRLWGILKMDRPCKDAIDAVMMAVDTSELDQESINTLAFATHAGYEIGLRNAVKIFEHEIARLQTLNEQLFSACGRLAHEIVRLQAEVERLTAVVTQK